MKFTLPGGGLFSSPSPQLPPAPAPLPTENDAEVKRKKDEARIAASRRQGLLSTNLTSGTGTGTGSNEATTERKTLLGA